MVSEKAFQAQVIALCRLNGLHYFHPYDSRKSVPGYPDLTIVGPGGVVWAELKAQAGKATAAQTDWAEALTEAGCEWHLWRPSDLRAIAERLRGLRTP